MLRVLGKLLEAWRVPLGPPCSPAEAVEEDMELSSPPHELRIERYSETGGYHLVCVQVEVTTHIKSRHKTLEEAVAKAEAEFNVKPDKWLQLDVSEDAPLHKAESP